MDEKEKKTLIALALKEILPLVLTTFLQGKTKLGVYILALTYATAKYTFGVDLPEPDPSKIPTTVDVGVGVGALTVGIGLVHDLIKKGALIAGGIKAIFAKNAAAVPSK